MKAPVLILALILAAAMTSQAQSIDGCTVNRSAPPAGMYSSAPHAEISVYFVSGMFTTEQRETLVLAMQNWTVASRKVGAGVRFDYAGETAGLVNCSNCLTITRREVFKNDRKHYAFFNPLRQDSQGVLISAWIDFDFATTSPQALQGFMAHELGHGMGLWDCRNCKKKQTIMNGFPGINKDNGLIEPSFCDLEVVRQVYQRRLAANTQGGPD